MTPRRLVVATAEAGAKRDARHEQAIAELALSSGGLRGLCLVDTRTSTMLASRMLMHEEMVNLERVMTAMPDVFQAGVSMEMLAAREDEAPVELTELILVADDRVVTVLSEPRGRFGLAAILAAESNIALELNGLRRALRSLEEA